MPFTRTLFTCLFTSMLLSGCGASQAEMDNLKRRISTLERRVRSLEGGPAKAKSKVKSKRGRGKAKAKNKVPAEPGAQGSVDIAGDALRVFVAGPRKRLPVPGIVPAGSYEILATFQEDKAPIVAGKVTLAADAKVLITCEAAQSRCLATDK